jgi:DNA-binding LacI/PurR family transcriptional regulator
MDIGLNKKLTLRRELENNIISGIFRCGEQLPSERKICLQYNVSRPIISEVFQNMIADGLLERQQGKRSTFISEKALNLLVGYKNSFAMTIDVVIPIIWMNNPLIIKMFSIMRKYLNPNIHFKVHICNWMSLVVNEKKKSDVLVVFNVYEHANLINKDMQKKIKSEYKDIIIINEKMDGLNYIGPDHIEGGRLMARHLLDNNHKISTCVVSNLNMTNDTALRHHGFRDEFSQHGKTTDVLFAFNHRQQMTTLADLIFYQEPTVSALACFQDLYAAFIYEAIRQRGNMRIPEDISIIGFDDQYLSQYMSPPLTTVKYPAEIIGNRLAEYLNSIFNGKAVGIDEKVIPVLMNRGSVIKL